MFRRLIGAVLGLAVAGMATIADAGERENLKGDPIFVGSIVYSAVENNFSNFIEENEGRLVYIKADAGHVSSYSHYQMEEQCSSVLDWVHEVYKLDENYLFGHPNEEGTIFIQLIKKVGDEIDCGSTVRIETRHASVGVLETGTGIAVYPIEGFFEVVRTGRWNDMHRQYVLKSRDVKYSRIEEARKRAAVLSEKN